MPAGRPSEYDPSYCEKVVEWGKLGKSIAWWAAELRVSRNTLTNWCDEYPEFLEAFTQAKLDSQRWWEDLGQSYVLERKDGARLNPGIYNRSMAARFPDDWREKTETALTGANGGPVQIMATEHDQNL